MAPALGPAIVPLVPLLFALPTGADVALPSDNDLSRFRLDPAFFNARWPEPRLLSGLATRPGSGTDAVIPGGGAGGSSSWAAHPWVDRLYPFAWEREFMGEAAAQWTRRWWWVSYVASSSYLIGLCIGTSSMRDRAPYSLTTALKCWNLLLFVFSFVGMMRTVPHLVLVLSEFGLEYSVCRCARVSYGSGAVGMWVFLFILSKYAELLDTAFLVVRKRKVSFLHWYHHCSVLLYCWHAFVWEMPSGIYFVSMNYSVHAVMYLYYLLAAVCGRPPRWGLLVTVLQLVQMAVGIMITLFHLNILAHGTVTNCDGHIPNLAAALGMYASYFILFAQFLFSRYCLKREGDGLAKLKKVD
uniref:Elongation of fatty acids protein n=1 Tax=Alexandrium monilatum TaxID=311494 RepID=A0A7S4SAW4_9DINO